MIINHFNVPYLGGYKTWWKSICGHDQYTPGDGNSHVGRAYGSSKERWSVVNCEKCLKFKATYKPNQYDS